MNKSHRNTEAQIKLLIGATFNETNSPTLCPDRQSDFTARQQFKRAISRHTRGTIQSTRRGRHRP